jgi:hypothetical protein
VTLAGPDPEIRRAAGRVSLGGAHCEGRTKPVTGVTRAQRIPEREAATSPERSGGGPRSVRRRSAASADPVAAAAQRLGIERLHPEQEQVISDVLAGRDVLMILPTGFGKSACYQIPAMVLDKPVVMISPLLALLRDQHNILLERGIDCVRLDGSVRARARREALERINAGGPLLVMTTPETLAVTDVAEALAKSGVGVAAVDEAHCISEWGHDFRPAYRRLGARLRGLGSPPILALTATATDRVRTTIVNSLGMRDPSIVASSPHRSNLAFEVIPCEGDMRLRALLRLVRRLRRPGIIYCATRREVDTVYALLRRFGIPVHRYHGAMNATDRNAEQQRFMRSRRPRRQEVELHPARRPGGPEDPRSPAVPQPGAPGSALSTGGGPGGLGPGGAQPVPGSPGTVGGSRAADHRSAAGQDRGGGADRGR